jgi:hypothetical protein
MLSIVERVVAADYSSTGTLPARDRNDVIGREERAPWGSDLAAHVRRDP